MNFDELVEKIQTYSDLVDQATAIRHEIESDRNIPITALPLLPLTTVSGRKARRPRRPHGFVLALIKEILMKHGIREKRCILTFQDIVKFSDGTLDTTKDIHGCISNLSTRKIFEKVRRPGVGLSLRFAHTYVNENKHTFSAHRQKKVARD